jgi:hypothetical protein
MQVSQLPSNKVPAPWASSASGSLVVIPPVTVAGGAGHASWTQGIPAECMEVGGIPPFGQEQNGFEQVVSSWVWWLNAGAPVPYDSAFSATIGGYPYGAMVWTAPGTYYISTADNNTTAPPSSSWISSRLVPAFTQLAPQVSRVHGALITPGYSNSITVSGVAGIAGQFIIDGYINYYTSAITDGEIVATLTNSLNSTQDADGTQVSQYHRIIVPASAGQTMTATFAITGSSSLSPSTAASYAVSFIFQPFF